MARQTRILSYVILFALAAVLIAGCAAPAPASSSKQMETVTDSYAGEAAPAPQAPAQPQEAAYGAGAGIPSSQDRMIIQTATLSVVVQDTAASMDAIRAIVQGMEGYVSASSASYSGEQLYGHMTVRVPAGELDGALEQIKALAQRVQNEDTSGQDVTEEFTDLSARLLNLEATETELRELLASVRERTGKAEDILAVYRELTQIRGEIEQIKGRMQYLQRMTALATIEISLMPSEAEKPLVEAGWNPGLTVRNAFRALLDAGQVILDIFIYFVIVVLPILIVILIPVALLVWFVRWLARRRRRPAV